MSSQPSTLDPAILASYLEKLDFDTGALVSAARHHQGEVKLFQPNHPKLPDRIIVKRPKGSGLERRLSIASIQREHIAYQRAQSVPGLPQCFGLFDNQCLVLEHIDGQPIGSMHTESLDWADGLLETIKSLHRCGVAHGDLKKKDNVLITPANRAYVIDLGTAVVRKKGFHPINHWLFDLLAQTDLNAWIKHKYGGYDGVSPTDLRYLNRSWVERGLSHWRSRRRS